MPACEKCQAQLTKVCDQGELRRWSCTSCGHTTATIEVDSFYINKLRAEASYATREAELLRREVEQLRRRRGVVIEKAEAEKIKLADTTVVIKNLVDGELCIEGMHEGDVVTFTVSSPKRQPSIAVDNFAGGGKLGEAWAVNVNSVMFEDHPDGAQFTSDAERKVAVKQAIRDAIGMSPKRQLF